MVGSRGSNEQSGESVRSFLASFQFSSDWSSSSEEESPFYAQTLVFSIGLLVALLICIFVRSSKKLHVCPCISYYTFLSLSILYLFYSGFMKALHCFCSEFWSAQSSWPFVVHTQFLCFMLNIMIGVWYVLHRFLILRCSKCSCQVTFLASSTLFYSHL